MTHSVVIKSTQIVNQRAVIESDLRIKGQRISHINQEILATKQDRVIEANGLYLLPGVIDDQAHFREPSLTHKATSTRKSQAVVVSGITHYMEMPNVNDQTASSMRFAFNH